MSSFCSYQDSHGNWGLSCVCLPGQSAQAKGNKPKEPNGDNRAARLSMRRHRIVKAEGKAAEQMSGTTGSVGGDAAFLPALKAR